MTRIFAGYSRKDEAAARDLIADLGQAHLSVWHDQALHGGDPWWQDILRRIRQCDVFLFALSNNSLASKPCLTELSYARALGIPLLPVQVGSVGNLRLTPVADIQVVDYRERTPANGMALIEAVQEAATGRRPLPDPLPEPPPVPFEYLLRLGSAIAAAQLTPDQQGDFIRQLRECLETEEDEAVRDDARELLRALRRRPDITYRNAQAVDNLLADLVATGAGDAAAAPARDRSTSVRASAPSGAHSSQGPRPDTDDRPARSRSRRGRAREARGNPAHRARVASGGAQRILPAAAPQLIERAVEEAISPGRVLFNPPEEMRQGRSERIEVAVTRTRTFDDDLQIGLRGRGVARIESIKTSHFMAVDLRGVGFEITPLSLPSNAEQFLNPVALWEFDVLPKRRGLQTLQVLVWMRIPVPDRQEVRVSIPVLERRVQVCINPMYGSKQFLKGNWQWLTGSAIGVVGLGGGLTAWIHLIN